ncbi:MAG: glycosyltransferase family 4 protein [Chloroflexi bacterium]|nr:glycosyltransferase family 4 protein [Chloroflexota bacterium]
MTTDTQPQPRHVLYVLSRFPALSHTFTANEMAVVQAEGAEVYAAPLWKTLPNTTPHKLEEPFLPKTIRCNLASPRFWLGALKGLVRQPQVLGLIVRLVPGHLKSIYLPFKLLATIPKGLYLGQWCIENEIDHLHAHFLTSPTTAAMIASAVSGAPYSYTAHAFDITSTHPKSVNGSIPLKCRRAIMGVTISQYNHHYLLEHWPTIQQARLDVIYNGIDTDLFQAGNGLRQRDANGPVRVLSVSRLETKKGYEFLIRAVAMLRERGFDVRLDVYGDGPLRASLQELIDSLGQGEHIVLHGAIMQTELATKYRAADLFALGSVPLPWGDADGLPTVLIEALAAELPSVSTQVTGIPEILRDGETGRCVPPRDAEALASALQWMIEHPDAARTMGQRGRELVLAQFDRRKNAKHLLECWQNIHAKQTGTGD